MADPERQKSLERQLAVYKRNIDFLEERASSVGGEMNLTIGDSNQLNYNRQKAAELEEALKALGGARAPDPAPVQSGQGNSSGISVNNSPGASANVSESTVIGRDQVNNTGGQPAPSQPSATPPQREDTPAPSQSNPIQLVMEFDASSSTPRLTMRASPILNLSRFDFTPPYDEATLPVVIRALDYAQGGAQQFSPNEATLLTTHNLWENGDVPPDIHERVGRAIYTSLGPTGKNALDRVRDYSIAEGVPIRYVLRFPINAVNLAALPWEAMSDGTQPVLLARGDDVDSCERYMDIERALPPPLSSQQRLRVVALSPQYGIQPNVRQAERKARLATWDKLKQDGLIEYDELGGEAAPLTVEVLTDYLRSLPRPPDIVHYYGHGIYRGGQGNLLFDGDEGGAAYVSATRLARILGNVRLVVLHACQSSMVTETGGLLTGVAPALSIVTGAVVAMQLSMRIKAATRFSQIFYDELLRRRASLQQAVAEGRQTLSFEEEDGASWYVPTLYIRSRNQDPVYLVK